MNPLKPWLGNYKDKADSLCACSYFGSNGYSSYCKLRQKELIRENGDLFSAQFHYESFKYPEECPFILERVVQDEN